jgi:hypothetical protein
LEQKKIIPMSAILETCEKVFNTKLELLSSHSKQLKDLLEDVENLHKDIECEWATDTGSQKTAINKIE